MKKLFLFPAFLLPLSLAAQPCLPDGIVFTSQAQIDDFSANYPGCTEIGGTVEISGVDIIGLSGLSAITHIGGSLLIHSNYLLAGLQGLDNLGALDGSLMLWSNDVLPDMSGLGSLASIGGDMAIGVNLNTCFCPIGNAALESFSGLENLSTVAGGFYVYKNPLLESFDGLNKLGSIGGSVSIADNTILPSFAGLESLETVGGNVEIGLHTLELPHGNPALASLNGFENLKEIGGGFSLVYNLSLTDISALNHALSIVSDLRIEKNALLSECAVQAVCDYLGSPPGGVFISENAGVCLSQAEVEAVCFVGTAETGLRPEDIHVFPNPSRGMFEIRGLEGMKGVAFLRNTAGQLAGQISFDGNTFLDGASLSAGVYLLEIRAESGTVVKKVLVE